MDVMDPQQVFCARRHRLQLGNSIFVRAEVGLALYIKNKLGYHLHHFANSKAVTLQTKQWGAFRDCFGSAHVFPNA